ncbi:MAG: thermonuclease family protein [Bradymonadaceae bacterium]
MSRTTATLVAIAICGLFAGRVGAHPGGTDEEGCHVCRTDCEQWDEEAGARHCHGSEETAGGSEDSEDPEESDDEGRSPLQLDEDEPAVVREVTDGDTVVVSIPSADGRRVEVRMMGIDCPESSVNPKCRETGREGGPDCQDQIPAGRRATRATERLLEDETVRLESGGGEGHFKRGDYGRLLAYIRLPDGRDLGAVLIKGGYCSDFGDTYPHPRQTRYEKLEQQS